MNPNKLVNNIVNLAKSNAPEVLAALGISGVVSTAYLTAKSTFKASRVIEREQDRLDRQPKSHPLDNMEKTKLVWSLYIPPAISGALTIVCIVSSSRASARRTAAAVTAYSITEKAFTEYKDKVAEQITANKQQKIHDEIAQDRINQSPPPQSSQVIMLGPGQVLCCELRTMRYFLGDMEGLRKAENDVNNWLNTTGRVALTDFYALIDLEPTAESDYNGWDGDDLMTLIFSHGLAPDGRPCLTFDYNYVRPI